MKRLLGLVVLAGGLALPAHAQAARAMSSSNGSSAAASSGGGGFSSGSSVGGSRPTSYPVAHFNVTSVSGSQQDYTPSTFLPYDNAVATGRAILDAAPKTLDEAAREIGTAHKEKARLALVQDANGKPIIQLR